MRKLKVQKTRIPEKARQTAGLYVLRLYGYVVLEMAQKKTPASCGKCSRNAKKTILARCPSCEGIVWNGISGNTEGTPDLFVSHERWALPIWMPLEYKSTDTDVREAQQKLIDRGLSQIVHDEHEAVAAVLRIEAAIGIEPNPRLLRWEAINRPGVWLTEAQLPF
jgi:hypothetical protein